MQPGRKNVAPDASSGVAREARNLAADVLVNFSFPRSLRERDGRGVCPYTDYGDSHVGNSPTTLEGTYYWDSHPGDRIWVMQFYRRNLPHLQKDFTPHFITFVTKFRWILPPAARDIVLSSCCHDHRFKYELYVAVVIPDHAHMILTPLVNEQRQDLHSLIDIMRTIKSASAHLINRQLKRVGSVWQEESFDHVLRSSESLDTKVEYVLQNPVRK